MFRQNINADMKVWILFKGICWDKRINCKLYDKYPYVGLQISKSTRKREAGVLLKNKEGSCMF